MPNVNTAHSGRYDLAPVYLGRPELGLFIAIDTFMQCTYCGGNQGEGAWWGFYDYTEGRTETVACNTCGGDMDAEGSGCQLIGALAWVPESDMVRGSDSGRAFPVVDIDGEMAYHDPEL